MDNNIDELAAIANPIQKKAYDILREELLRFEISDGKLVSGQDLRRKLIAAEDKIEALFKVKIWEDSITSFLNTFQTIEERNVSMQRDYNQLRIDTALLTPARKLIYDQAKYELIQGIAPQYVQPAKFLLMNQVTGGASIQDALTMLERWDKGELSNGKYTNDMPAPNLQKYATQIARDTSYGVDRTINSIIKDRYSLGKFIYAGGIVEDSRPLCRYLVSLNRDIEFDELPPLLSNPQYQKGLIADTTKENFTQRCGGYACRHKVFAVR